MEKVEKHLDRKQEGFYLLLLHQRSICPGGEREDKILWFKTCKYNTIIYYMEKSVLLGTKPLVDSIRHFIRDPSCVFSVCHLCECRIVQ